MGWPEETNELIYYYPTSVLITSRDIITLWVARMVITGLFNCKAIPFCNPSKLQIPIIPPILILSQRADFLEGNPGK